MQQFINQALCDKVIYENAVVVEFEGLWEQPLVVSGKVCNERESVRCEVFF